MHECNLGPAAPFTVSQVHCVDITGAGWPRSYMLTEHPQLS